MTLHLVILNSIPPGVCPGDRPVQALLEVGDVDVAEDCVGEPGVVGKLIHYANYQNLLNNFLSFIFLTNMLFSFYKNVH